jgi:hypothetical protein
MLQIRPQSVACRTQCYSMPEPYNIPCQSHHIIACRSTNITECWNPHVIACLSQNIIACQTPYCRVSEYVHNIACRAPVLFHVGNLRLFLVLAPISLRNGTPISLTAYLTRRIIACRTPILLHAGAIILSMLGTSYILFHVVDPILLRTARWNAYNTACRSSHFIACRGKPCIIACRSPCIIACRSRPVCVNWPWFRTPSNIV